MCALSHLFLEKNFSKIKKVLIPKKKFSKNENYCVPLGHTLVKSYIYIYIYCIFISHHIRSCLTMLSLSEVQPAIFLTF